MFILITLDIITCSQIPLTLGVCKYITFSYIDQRYVHFRDKNVTSIFFVLYIAVLERYFVSLYEKQKQTREGKYGEHKKRCRRNGRKRDVSNIKMFTYYIL